MSRGGIGHGVWGMGHGALGLVMRHASFVMCCWALAKMVLDCFSYKLLPTSGQQVNRNVNSDRAPLT